MFVHSVYFWLRDDLSAEERDRFARGVNALRDIESVRHAWIGGPAPTPDRPVIDSSYSCALIVVFDDMGGHDEYQVHPLHERFKQECGDLWTRVLIYDSLDDWRVQ